MPFSTTALSALDRAKNALVEHVKSFDRLTMTYAEARALLVPPEDHEVIRRASRVCQVSTWPGFNIIGETYTAEIKGSWDGFTVPKRPEIQASAPAELLRKVRAWVGRREILMGNDWNLGGVLNMLHGRCANPSQARYVFPSLLTLCRWNDDLNDFAAKYTDYVVPKNPPAIPPDGREMIHNASTFVTAAAMLPEHADAITGDFVELIM